MLGKTTTRSVTPAPLTKDTFVSLVLCQNWLAWRYDCSRMPDLRDDGDILEETMTDIFAESEHPFSTAESLPCFRTALDGSTQHEYVPCEMPRRSRTPSHCCGGQPAEEHTHFSSTTFVFSSTKHQHRFQVVWLRFDSLSMFLRWIRTWMEAGLPLVCGTARHCCLTCPGWSLTSQILMAHSERFSLHHLQRSNVPD